MILQIFIESKKGYDSRAEKLFWLIKRNVKSEDFTDLRLFHKYVIENFSLEFADAIRHKVLSDSVTDNVYADFLPVTSDYKHFTLELPKNQYSEDIADIRRCFASLKMPIEPKIRQSIVVCVGKNVGELTMDAVKNCLASHGYEYIPEPQKKSDQKKPTAKKSYIDGFIKMNDIDVYQFHRKNGIKMTSEELCRVRDHFKALGRDPLWIEVLGIDSCISRADRVRDTVIRNIEIKDAPLNVPVKIALDEYKTAVRSLFDDKNVPLTPDGINRVALLSLKQRGLAADIERLSNGGIAVNVPADVDGVYEQWMMTVKASKCSECAEFDYLGDAVAAHIPSRTAAYQSMSVDLIGYKNIKELKTDFESLRRAESEKKFLSECGVSSVSQNCVVANSEAMNVRFTASAAAAPKTNLQKPAQGQNDTVIMLGGRLTKNTLPIEGSVQRSGSYIMRRFLKLMRNPRAAVMIKRSTALKNGLVCGVLDLCDSGAVINIDRVIGKDSPDIALAVSEANSRILVLCDRANAKSLIGLARQAGLAANNVAVTDESDAIHFYYKGDMLASLSRRILKYASEPKKTDAVISAPRSKLFAPLSEEFTSLSPSQAFLKNLSVNNYSEKSLYENESDFSAGGGAVLAPRGGKFRTTPEGASVCKLPTGAKSTNTVTIMSCGSVPRITHVSPFHGAAFAVMESISKIVACGGNSLNIKLATAEHYLDPATAPVKWSEPLGAMLGSFEAQMNMGLPVVDNTVSIEPVGNFKSAFSFVSFAAAPAKTNEIISAEFKQPGSAILLIPMPTVAKTGMPDFDKARVIYRQFHYLSQSSKVISASVVRAGGAAAAVAKMSFGNGIGVEFTNKDFSTLFEDKPASIIVETENPGAFSGMDTVLIGKTVADDCFIFDGVKIPIKEAQVAYTLQGDKHLRRNFNKKAPMIELPLCRSHAEPYNGEKFLKPRVIIPIFPSTVGENEMQRGFEAAGGAVSEYSFDFAHVDESRETLSSLILKSQILALPDSVDSLLSVNACAAALSDPMTVSAIRKFLQGGGLILGAGGGFMTLIKLGLLGVRADSMAFTDNADAARRCSPTTVRILSTKSPWLNHCEAGDVFTVSNSRSRGRFVTDETTAMMLSANGRIAAQFVDPAGKPAAKAPFNPNGAAFAIESITSPDGHILGKTTLCERYVSGCLANIHGAKDPTIFRSGVQYFM